MTEKTYLLTIDEEVYNMLKARAALEGRSIKETLTIIILKYSGGEFEC